MFYWNGIDGTLLLFPIFNDYREKLLTTVNPIIAKLHTHKFENSIMAKILLYGDKSLNYEENRTLLKATVYYILNTGRFSHVSES